MLMLASNRLVIRVDGMVVVPTLMRGPLEVVAQQISPSEMVTGIPTHTCIQESLLLAAEADPEWNMQRHQLPGEAEPEALGREAMA